MSTNPQPRAPTVALMLPTRNGRLLTFAKAVHDALLAHPQLFPDPNPSLVVFADDIAAWDEAETAAAGRGKGAATVRNAKKQRVKEDLHHLRDYIQGVVEAQASPSEAAAVIEAAFMSVRKIGKRTRPELAAKNTGAPGVVLLEARSVGKTAVYYWEYNPGTDPEGWIRVPETVRASTTIAGLTTGQTYGFRFRALTRKGERGYSQVVRLLAH